MIVFNFKLDLTQIGFSANGSLTRSERKSVIHADFHSEGLELKRVLKVSSSMCIKNSFPFGKFLIRNSMFEVFQTGTIQHYPESRLYWSGSF